MFRRINFSIYFQIAFILLFIKCSFTAPIGNSESLYAKFVKDMRNNNCAMPEQIHLPFNTTSAENFGKMPSSLKICQNLDVTKRTKEADILCKEIFGILKTISCPLRSPTGIVDSEINVTLSNQVCKDFSSMQISVSNGNSLLKRLTDKFLCDIMCDAEFEKACQILLWSYQVLEQIDNNQNPENLPHVKDPSQHEMNSNIGNKKIQVKSNEKKNLKEPKIPDTLDIQSKGTKEQQFVKTMTPHIKEPSILMEVQNGNFPQQPVNKDPQIRTQADNIPPTELEVNPKVKVADTVKVEDALGNVNTIGEPYQANQVDNPPQNAGSDVHQEDGEANANEVPESEKEPNKTGSAALQEEIVDPHDREEDVDPHEFEDRTQQMENDKDHVEVSSDAAKNQGKNNKIISKLKDTNQDVTNKNQDKDNGILTYLEDANRDETQGQNPGKAVITTQGNTKDTTAPQITKTLNQKVNVSAESTLAGKVTSSSVGQKTATKTSSILPQTKDAVSDSEISSVLPTTGDLGSETFVTTVVLEKMEEDNDALHPVDKEPDQYPGAENDLDPEEEYNGEGGIYEPEKIKEPKSDKPDTVEVPKVADQSEKTYKEFPPRESFGRRPEDIQVIAAFPEQEDSHFFFYFLSIVLILMAGYLIFHNKQKIIALIVEGRHERRRRSHGVGYKKLETK